MLLLLVRVQGATCIFISIQCIFSPSRAVSRSWPPRADYEVELVCGEFKRGASVCMLHASPSSVRGPWQFLVWPGLRISSLSGNQSLVWAAG